MTMTSPTPASGSEPFHRPIVEPHLVQVIGTTGLLRPAHLADERHAILVRWQLPGWRTVSSFGAGDAVETTASLDEFRDAVFLASDRLHLVPKQLGATTLMVAVINDFGFSDDALADLAARIVTAQRAFFAEPGPPFFLITAIPFGNAQGAQYGGTGLTSSFAIFLSPRFAATGDLAWLLGHELFHSWNGRVIQPDPPEELMYWFSEGFTNFYARRLLYRAGLVDLDGYVKQLDDELVQYWLSPVRDASNAAIRDGFWKQHELERLPYQRGDLLALVLDRALAARGASLDTLMKQLVAEGRAGGTVSVAKLLARLPVDVAAALQPTIVDGAPLALAPDLLAPCLALAMHSIGRFELGFDMAATQATMRVTGLVPGSRAAAAGLHEGDAIQGWSVYDGNPEKAVELHIGGRAISYLPQGAPVDVPQFTVADRAACPKLL